ncbi:MAG TPA: hypothetical protein VGR69_07815 [Candidatus Rubrimentiphilum sp.]|nr:hypothetical protein [Candidatus Rubrimentiphilum sp.]
MIATTAAAAVLLRYATQLERAKEPQTLVFTYIVSQLGPQDIDQTHRIYRSGNLVRDETLIVDGTPLRSTKIARYRNRYTLRNIAPHTGAYRFSFLGAIKNGKQLDYVYRAIPLGAPTAFAVQRITIDGRKFLPREIRFHTIGVAARGFGTMTFVAAGKYWVPSSVAVQGTVNGRIARERILFSGYQFPPTLPRSIFTAPRPLPLPVLPEF